VPVVITDTWPPIMVNIEFKILGSGGYEAKVKLSIWVAAQFNKLNVLARRRMCIEIPLISVEAHDWRVYIAYQKEGGEIVSYFATYSLPRLFLQRIDYMG
jgi:hypothetical protein